MSTATTWLIINATWQTVYMVGIATLIAVALGIPLGTVLFLTGPQQLKANAILHKSLDITVNIVRSFPFIILMIAIMPFTRLITGTSIGTNAAIVPLTIGAIPFVARLIANAFCEVDTGLVEATTAMGASLLQIIRHVFLSESLPNIIQIITMTMITLIGYSAMAGTVGGGGLGDVAVRYGYERFELSIMVITVLILIIIVQLIQVAGNIISRKLSH